MAFLGTSKPYFDKLHVAGEFSLSSPTSLSPIHPNHLSFHLKKNLNANNKTP